MTRQLPENPTPPADLFDGTAPYYARFRPPYPDEALDYAVRAFPADPRVAVLDLGCGSGQLAVPLARAGFRVWAVDPDPEMIAEGVRREKEAADPGEIHWSTARAEDLDASQLPAIGLCTMGSSFHWMDRERVAHFLDAVVEPGGGIALFSGSASIWSRTGALEGEWVEPTREVITRFLGPQRRAGSGTYSHPKRTHEQVLRDSPFGDVEQRRFTTTRFLSVEEVIGLQLSTSYASPSLLGDRLPDFRGELTRRLDPIMPSGGFPTVEHTDVILARRPARSGGR